MKVPDNFIKKVLPLVIRDLKYLVELKGKYGDISQELYDSALCSLQMLDPVDALCNYRKAFIVHADRKPIFVDVEIAIRCERLQYEYDMQNITTIQYQHLLSLLKADNRNMAISTFDYNLYRYKEANQNDHQ